VIPITLLIFRFHGGKITSLNQKSTSFECERSTEANNLWGKLEIYKNIYSYRVHPGEG